MKPLKGKSVAGIKAGDRIRVKNFSKDLNGKIGFVHHVNGEEVYVRMSHRPKNESWQLYRWEVELAKKGAK